MSRCSALPTHSGSPISGTSGAAKRRRAARPSSFASASVPAMTSPFTSPSSGARGRMRPSFILTRSTRRTASSIRSIGTRPSLTTASMMLSCLR
eukprot:scaffold60014_cov25-Tisochrysis_lutea.AAC.2